MKLRRKTLEAVLFSGVWVYGPMDMGEDRWGKMMFLQSGRTFGYGHANEYGWDFLGDTFRFLTKEGVPTSTYDEVFTEDGRVLLQGRAVHNPLSLYRLEQADPNEE